MKTDKHLSLIKSYKGTILESSFTCFFELFSIYMLNNKDSLSE